MPIYGITSGSDFRVQFTILEPESLNGSLILYTGQKAATPGMGSDYVALTLVEGESG